MNDYEIKEVEFNGYIVKEGPTLTIGAEVDWDGYSGTTIFVETNVEHLKKTLKYRPVDSVSLGFIDNIVNVTYITKKEDNDSVIVELIIDITAVAKDSHKSLSASDIQHSVKYILDSLSSMYEYRRLRLIKVNAVVSAAIFTIKVDQVNKGMSLSI